MDAITTWNLTKKYKDLIAVDHLNLSIRKGELFSLLGVNGAGKTTAIKMLSCLTLPSSGDAFLNGKSIVTQSADVKQIIGVSPQETAIAPNLTVQENLSFLCSLYHNSSEQQKQKVQELSDVFSLQDVLEKKACKLSGGWQRRLSIAIAMAGDPEILFLDEPTLGLDVIARSELWDTIRNLKKKATVVLTTHYMEEAEALSDRVGIMKDGKLLITGTIDEIKNAANETQFERAFVAIVRGNVQ